MKTIWLLSFVVFAHVAEDDFNLGFDEKTITDDFDA